MTSLIEKSPADGLCPVKMGSSSLIENPMCQMTSLIPFKGLEYEAEKALKAAHGVLLPTSGRALGRSGNRVIWFGNFVCLVGPKPDSRLGQYFAMTDQSDAWSSLSLSGKHARDILQRLCPIDLRRESFSRGHVACTLLGHMTITLHCVGVDKFDIYGFRSMAKTMVDEISHSMKVEAAYLSD